MSQLLDNLDIIIAELPILCWQEPAPPVQGTQPAMWDDLRQALRLISQALHDLENNYNQTQQTKIFGP